MPPFCLIAGTLLGDDTVAVLNGRVSIVNDQLDPTFRFVPLDWDGKIRMDCSSPHAMARLRDMAGDFDVAFANDPDADRHGIVTPGAGLLNPNHHLAACIAYLFGGMARERIALWYKRASLTDPLTGVANRRHFMERSETLLRRAAFERDDSGDHGSTFSLEELSEGQRVIIALYAVLQLLVRPGQTVLFPGGVHALGDMANV